ncbi:(d)CMP kinase [Halalkalibacter okhensis]|uniref:Cytidylate kinase n=1 Tax=Halalkalibacter okhensis TaxID=333138 RepID=A0A0B0IHQ7_9BACI|nr:(d)CMP kinase [Halalkalibacter okhensis]KHF40357.1 cytidylate kinase [Halalkalibacter okhensis]
MNKKMNIAIDGPAGAGKSTVAKLVAEQLDYLYIDTGAMYRTLTLAALREGIDLQDGGALTHILSQTTIHLQHEQTGVRVLLNNEDVTDAIRLKDVTSNVSLVSSHEGVRIEMVERQRRLAEKGEAVLDGRDIGTYVLPDAEVKVFLTASVEERARRRYEEQKEKGMPADLDQLKEEIAHRDQLDSTRVFAPLKKADDAVEIDSTTLSIPEVAEVIIGLAKERAR